MGGFCEVRSLGQMISRQHAFIMLKISPSSRVAETVIVYADDFADQSIAFQLALQTYRPRMYRCLDKFTSGTWHVVPKLFRGLVNGSGRRFIRGHSRR